MKSIALLLFALGGLTYAGFVLFAISGIQRLIAGRTASSGGSARFTAPHPSLDAVIILAARNEEKEIRQTLASLAEQKIEDGRLPDILLIDDRSTDRTWPVAQDFAAGKPNIRLLRQESVPPGHSPKKSALMLGIKHSSAPAILMTDADCRHHSRWAQTLLQSLPEEGGMAVGQARFIVSPSAPLWQRLQALDFAAQNVLAAGLIAAGNPFSCSGASLAFTRQAFRAVAGWEGVEEFTSGDDELLMRKFAKAGLPVVAVTGREAVVMTRPPGSLNELWHQRARWGSKTLHYPLNQRLILTGIFIFYLALVVTILMSLFGYFLCAFLGFGTKIMLDWALLRTGGPLFGDRFSKGEFLLAELLHPPVIVILAVFGAFGSFDWKGTAYKTRGQR